MRGFSFSFVCILFILTVGEIRAEDSVGVSSQENGGTKNNISSQEEGGTKNNISAGENNSTKNVSQPGEGGNNTNVVNFNDSFLSEEKEEEKVSDEDIAANQSILNESVEENQSGFLGWLGRFLGNIFDEINTDRIVDFLWNKSTMKHEGNEEYKAAKGRVDKHLIKKAFKGLFRKYLAGGEINEEAIHKFNGQYDKVKMFADILKNENNNFEDDSLRLIILEKVLGGREDDIHNVLVALDNVSEDKIAELQGLMAELKANEEEFVKCFADMSAVEKYNLERAAFYDKSGNYCKSQWMMVDKSGIHEASRGFVTWVKNIWKVLRFIIGFGVNIFVICFGFIANDGFYKKCLDSESYLDKNSSNNYAPILISKYLQIITCLPSFIYSGCTNIIPILQGIVAIIDLIICVGYFCRGKFIEGIKFFSGKSKEGCCNFINRAAVFCAGISIFLNFLDGLFGLKHVFNKKINKHLAFLLNKKFRYIKNYVETLKKIHVLINGDEVLAGAFKKELLSLEKVFGDEASNETKHMLTEMDKQKLYDSFDDVEDTGEAMFLFDKNKDIFSDCIVDINKINACVALKMNIPAEEIKKVEEENNNQEACKKEKDLSSEKVKEVNPEEKRDVKETIDNQEGNKKEENESVEKKDVKETIDNQTENKEKENEPAEKKDVKETIDNQEENKNKENKPAEKNDVKEETAKQDGVNIEKIKEEEQIEESTQKTTVGEPSVGTQNKSKKNKKRKNNKKRKKKRLAKKRQAKTNKNKSANRKKPRSEKTSAE